MAILVDVNKKIATGDTKTRNERGCEANIYFGEQELLRRGVGTKAISRTSR
jgi:hypothetical protein